MIKLLKILSKPFLLIIFIFSLSCEDQGRIVKCPDCLSTEPTKTDLEIKLDESLYGSTTVINVYEGNLEDSVIYQSFKTSSSSTSTSVTLNKKYTVTATYYLSGNYYIAVDSATPRVRYEKSQCDDPCFYIYDRKIDVRLKYTK
jgi:hypothetical protein